MASAATGKTRAIAGTADCEAERMATSVNVRKQNVMEVAAPVTIAYEHPWVVRFAHWVNAVAVLVLVGTGLQIFRAFPSFGPKIPQKNLLDVPRLIIDRK